MKITISGLSGCGNTTASTNVAEALGLGVFNYTLRNMASDFGVSFDELHSDTANTNWYDYALDNKIRDYSLKHDDFVSGSRLSGWIIDSPALRVWLNASLETRAKRIAQREKSPYEQVLERTITRDEADIARYKNVYGVDILDHDGFDLIVNTEYLTAEQVAALIVSAANLAKQNNIEKPHKLSKKISETIKENLNKTPVPKLVEEKVKTWQ